MNKGSDFGHSLSLFWARQDQDGTVVFGIILRKRQYTRAAIGFGNEKTARGCHRSGFRLLMQDFKELREPESLRQALLQ